MALNPNKLFPFIPINTTYSWTRINLGKSNSLDIHLFDLFYITHLSITFIVF